MKPGDRVCLIGDASACGTLLSIIGSQVRVKFDHLSWSVYTFIDRLRPLNAIERLADVK